MTPRWSIIWHRQILPWLYHQNYNILKVGYDRWLALCNIYNLHLRKCDLWLCQVFYFHSTQIAWSHARCTRMMVISKRHPTKCWCCSLTKFWSILDANFESIHDQTWLLHPTYKVGWICRLDVTWTNLLDQHAGLVWAINLRDAPASARVPWKNLTLFLHWLS
jgi:hypothetical protein